MGGDYQFLEILLLAMVAGFILLRLRGVLVSHGATISKEFIKDGTSFLRWLDRAEKQGWGRTLHDLERGTTFFRICCDWF